MCKSTAREEYITCYLGNTTAEVRDEQHSCMLPRQWGCIYSPHILFAALQDHRATPIKFLFSGFSSSNVGGRVIIVIITKRELHLKCLYIYYCQIGGIPSIVCTSLAVRDYVGLPIAF